jgi:hypothetical protein
VLRVCGFVGSTEIFLFFLKLMMVSGGKEKTTVASDRVSDELQ